MTENLHGIVAAYASPTQLLAALRRAREFGFERLEVNTPFPVAELEELLPGKRSPIARIMGGVAVLAIGGAYFLQWFAARDYPLNVGGRPLHSWPAFIPVTFELTVLTTALAGVAALLWLAGLPRLDYPLFAVAGFERASQDLFFLCVRSDDSRFDLEAVREVLRVEQPEFISEVRG
jgi:hypothetical protein